MAARPGGTSGSGEGDVVRLYIPEEFFQAPEEDDAWRRVGEPRLDVVYEDANILIVDKQPGGAVPQRRRVELEPP